MEIVGTYLYLRVVSTGEPGLITECHKPCSNLSCLTAWLQTLLSSSYMQAIRLDEQPSEV